MSELARPGLVPGNASVTFAELPTALPGLVLRRLTRHDAPALYALLQANRAHLTIHGDYRAQVAASLSTVEAELADAHATHAFGIFLRDRLIGRADLIPVDPPHYGLGYWLDEHVTGNGYASAAAASLVAMAFSALNATEIYAGVTPGNRRSEQLLQRLGFVAVASFDTHTRFRLTKPS